MDNVICQNCETTNPPNAAFCSKCSQILPAQNRGNLYTPPLAKPQHIGISTGVKLGIGGCIGVLICMGACVACLSMAGRNALESANVSRAPSFSSSSPSTPSKPAEADFKSTSMSNTLNFGGLSLRLSRVQIETNRVLVEMVIKNNSKGKMTFYPNQGNLVIGSDQLTASYTSAGSDLSGDIHPNVEKTGTLEFIMPQGKKLWLGKVNKIEFHFGNLWDGSYNMREVSLTLPVS